MKQPIWKTSKSHRKTLIKDVRGWVDGSSDRSATSSLFALLDKSIKVSIARPMYLWFPTWITSSRCSWRQVAFGCDNPRLSRQSKSRSRSACVVWRPTTQSQARRRYAFPAAFARFPSFLRDLLSIFAAVFRFCIASRMHEGPHPPISFYLCPFWHQLETLTLNLPMGEKWGRGRGNLAISCGND